MQESRNRYSWLEWANVLAMFAVVLFHIPSKQEMPFRDIEYIAVNIPFFILSGISFRIFLEHRGSNLSFITLITSRLKRFGIPTIIFFAIFYLLWLIIGKRLAGDTDTWYAPLLELMTGHLTIVLATYWFIICLFIIQLMYFTISYFTHNRAVVLGISILLQLLCFAIDIPNYYELQRAFLFMPFFSLGTCYSSSSKYEHKTIAIPVVCFITYCTICIFVFGIDLLNYGQGHIIGMILLTFILAISLFCSHLLDCPRFISFLRSGALVILATQNNIIGICKVMFDKLFCSHDFLANHIICKPITFLIVYIVTIPIILLFKTSAGRKLNCT